MRIFRGGKPASLFLFFIFVRFLIPTTLSLVRELSQLHAPVQSLLMLHFQTIIPGAVMNEQSFFVQVTYICEAGQVLRDEVCGQ